MTTLTIPEYPITEQFMKVVIQRLAENHLHVTQAIAGRFELRAGPGQYSLLTMEQLVDRKLTTQFHYIVGPTGDRWTAAALIGLLEHLDEGRRNTEYESPVQQRLDIICTCVEGGSDYWIGGYRNIVRDADLNYLSLEIKEDDDEGNGDGKTWFRVDEALIAEGIRRIAQRQVRVNQSIFKQAVMLYTNPDLPADIDADDADCILQAAIFNDIVYG